MAYNNLSEAMNDTTITNTIFNNTNSMNYLANNLDLVLEIKELDNYTNTLVPKLLVTTIFTDSQKYSSSLPFYLYNQGSYDSNIYQSNYDYGYYYSGSCTMDYTANLSNNGYINIGLSSCYGDCAGVVLGSSKVLDITNYNYMNVKVISISATGSPLNVGLSKTFAHHSNVNFRNSIYNTGITRVDIKNAKENYYPIMQIRECQNGKQFSASASVSQWWLE